MCRLSSNPKAQKKKSGHEAAAAASSLPSSSSSFVSPPPPISSFEDDRLTARRRSSSNSNNKDNSSPNGSALAETPATSSSSSSSSSWISKTTGYLLGGGSDDDNHHHHQHHHTPLPVYYYVVLAAIYVGILPSSFFVNRGFTIWFHHVAIFYVLTGCNSRFLEKFQILSGTSISLGWYSSIIYDYLKYDRFFHPLYENMPPAMRRYMYLNNSIDHGNPRALDFISTTSLTMMFISHVLDLIAHPLLTYYFWRRYSAKRRRNDEDKMQKAQGEAQGESQGSDKSNKSGNASNVSAFSVVHDIISSWEVIMSAYVFSRCWSMFHTYHNFGQTFNDISLFYVGHDVYIINELDSWYPAYIAEGFVYGSAAIYRLVLSYVNFSSSSSSSILSSSGKDKTTKSSSSSKSNQYETKPSLTYSESTLSTYSASSGLGLQ